jgi:hypothetical protein
LIAAAKNPRGLDDQYNLGTRWYHDFLKRHSKMLSTSGTVIKDVKRRTRKFGEHVQKCMCKKLWLRQA